MAMAAFGMALTAIWMGTEPLEKAPSSLLPRSAGEDATDRPGAIRTSLLPHAEEWLFQRIESSPTAIGALPKPSGTAGPQNASISVPPQ